MASIRHLVSRFLSPNAGNSGVTKETPRIDSAIINLMAAFVADGEPRMCWPPIRMGHPMRLVRFLEMYGVKHDTVDGYNIAMTRIAPPQRQTGF